MLSGGCGEWGEGAHLLLCFKKHINPPWKDPSLDTKPFFHLALVSGGCGVQAGAPLRDCYNGRY